MVKWVMDDELDMDTYLYKLIDPGYREIRGYTDGWTNTITKILKY